MTTTEALNASALDAEQAVLGSMMSDPHALAVGLDALRPGDFYRPAHMVVFEAMAMMDQAGLPVDPITLHEWLDQHPGLGKYGGAPYLHDLLSSVPSAVNMMFHVNIVLEQSSRRSLAVAGTQILQIAAEADCDAATRAEQAGKVLYDATERTATCSGPVPLAALLPAFLDELEKPDEVPGIPVEWKPLRPILSRLRPGELMTVGGRPGTGKTSVLIGFAERAAISHKIPTLFMSLEMSAMEIVQRIVSAWTRVPLADIRNRTCSDGQLGKIVESLDILSNAPLLINDDPYPKLNDIRSQLRMMRRKGADAELLLLDYLQLMTGSGRTESRQLEVAEVARGLKLSAKEFGLPVVVGSQLNRSPEGRADKRPMLGDLRESGSVEQDSDIVLLLYRESMYNPDAHTADQILEVNIAKQRNGGLGTVKLAFRDAFASVENPDGTNTLSQRPRQAPPLPHRPDPLPVDGEEPPALGGLDLSHPDP